MAGKPVVQFSPFFPAVLDLLSLASLAQGPADTGSIVDSHFMVCGLRRRIVRVLPLLEREPLPSRILQRAQ